MGGPNNTDDIIDSEDEIFANAYDLKQAAINKGAKTLRASRKQLGNINTSQAAKTPSL